jgi:hypothetical protein
MLTFLALAHAAESSPTPGPFDAPSRYFLQSTVQLPLFMWFGTPFNQQARVTAFDLRMVLACDAGVPNTKRSLEVRCTLEDLGLSASGMEQERGLLQPILTELDEILTGSHLQLQVRDNQVLNVGLDVYRRNNRVGRLNENMRLVLSRAIAGLDFAGPPAGGEELASWPEYGSMLAWIPAPNGTAGMSELVYRPVEETPATQTLVYGGSGLMIPGDSTNRYEARISGDLVLDRKTGRLLDRTWLVVATPTPSSGITEGYAGYPYLQQGRLVGLREGQSWDVGESLEIPPSEFSQTSIQQQFQLGTGSLSPSSN